MKHHAKLSCLLLFILNLGFAQNTRGVEMLWDTWGVPHVFAETNEGMFYGFGRAQVEAHPELLLRLYATARGRGAEYYGAVVDTSPFPTDMVNLDRLVRTMGFPERAKLWYRLQTSDFQTYLNAFAQGINDVAQNLELSVEARRVLPVTATDVLAHTLRVYLSFVASDCYDAFPGENISFDLSSGSNGWTLGPSKTENGHTMLLANPHLLWSGNETWFEAHLESPDYKAYGATLVGIPVLSIAFNDRLAWTHTVNTADTCDRYSLTLKDEGYLLDGEVTAFEQHDETLQVFQPDGTVQTETLTVKRSVHGPVFEQDGEAMAVRAVGVDHLQTPNVLGQWFALAQTQTFDDAQQLLAKLENPFFNTIYADKDGHTLLLFGGRTPVRSRGDSEFWYGTVPGDDASLVWNTYLDYTLLPKAVDTPWAQNSNSVPWWMSETPLEPEDYPAYLSFDEGPNLREQRGLELLQNTEVFSLETLIAAKYDHQVLLAERVLPDLMSAATKSDHALVQEAVTVLDAWDRQLSPDSEGAVLFWLWYNEIDWDDSLFAQPWDSANRSTTPHGLANPDEAVAALERAATTLQDEVGSLAVPYGEVMRLRRGEIDLPANGGDDSMGVFRALWPAPNEDGSYSPIGGDSWTFVVEFSEPLNVQVLLTYGNSSSPASAYFGDQLELSSQEKMRVPWRTKEDIEAHLEKRESF